MKTLTVKNVVLGAGPPKIIVSIMGKDAASLTAEAKRYASLDFDVLEWRADHFAGGDAAEAPARTPMGKENPPFAALADALAGLRARFPEKPLLAAFRTKKEGGERELAAQDYIALNRAMIDTGNADMIDLELSLGGGAVKETVAYAHEKGVAVVISSHDFHKTPPKEEIVARLRAMQELGADIAKIAVMPQNTADLLTLLTAGHEMRSTFADRPFIAISMGKTGVISRLAAEAFGSCATFGAAGTTSAPGQIDVGELRRILTLLHR